MFIDLEDRNYNAKLFTIQIGSRGYIDSHYANIFIFLVNISDPKVKISQQNCKKRKIQHMQNLITNYYAHLPYFMPHIMSYGESQAYVVDISTTHPVISVT